MKQWVIDTPKYAEQLLEGLDRIDWPQSTKEMQRNWIGKSVGAEVNFKVKDSDKIIYYFYNTSRYIIWCYLLCFSA